MIRVFLSFFLICLMAASAWAPAWAKDTEMKITVIAKDAKFIGSTMGGVQVTVKDRRNGAILADGVAYGDTGNTQTIMADPKERDAILADENSAKFQYYFELMEPIPVTIEVKGPLAQPQSMVTVTQDMVLIPEKDYSEGNGIMIELPGFAIDVLNPPANRRIPIHPDIPVTIVANILKLCGCHIAEGSPWPPERYDVDAYIYINDLLKKHIIMEYNGVPGQFIGPVFLDKPATYKVFVTAFDRETKESSMDITTFVLTE